MGVYPLGNRELIFLLLLLLSLALPLYKNMLYVGKGTFYVGKLFYLQSDTLFTSVSCFHIANHIKILKIHTLTCVYAYSYSDTDRYTHTLLFISWIWRSRFWIDHRNVILAEWSGLELVNLSLSQPTICSQQVVLPWLTNL